MGKRFWPGYVARFAIALISVLFACAAYSGHAKSEPGETNPFVERFIARNATAIADSGQLVFAASRDPSSAQVRIHAVEKSGGAWRAVFPAFSGMIGKKGFAPMGAKREGDGKSPSGIFALGTAFGYGPSVATRLPYRQATEDDYWVDDVASDDYNKWVKGKPNAASFEKMKREDDHYKYGVVIEYNTRPIVKGNGSAIFLHVWKEGKSTSGCVAIPEAMVLKLLGWLDPAKRPLIVMGAEAELLK